ncbi:MAG: hypothetical protein LBT79_04110 [Elusimicrobiota bacterium]|nr:hypothetical protein [Elusimicrobiota bacterium]
MFDLIIFIDYHISVITNKLVIREKERKMNFNDFKQEFSHLPIINSMDIVKRGNFQTMFNQINNWQKKGLLIQLRRGLYLLNQNDRKITATNYFLSNQIYSPSYISLESALSLYEIIPETPSVITAVSSKKTKLIKNEAGIFSYQHIKQSAYRGFIEQKDINNFNCFIAQPEKAVLDFIYFNLARFKTDDIDIFETSYRFQNLDSLNINKLKNYLTFFDNQKLNAVVKNLCDIIKKEKNS